MAGLVAHDEGIMADSQLVYERAGFPLLGCTGWDEVVEVRLGARGREAVARTAIPAWTFLRVQKVRLGMTDAEMVALNERLDVFIREAVPQVLGYPSLVSLMVAEDDVPHGSDLSAYVGAFVRAGLLDDPMVRDLMAFDAFDAAYVTLSLRRMLFGDVMWLHFWVAELEGVVAADTVWAVFTFIRSHSFLSERGLLTFGLFCLANCPLTRWEWYLRGSDEAAPPESGDTSGLVTAELLGNFEEISPSARQTHVAEGQLAGDECVLVIKDVAAGAALEMDYGEKYMLAPEAELQQFRGSEFERVVDAVLWRFDPRVLAAFRAYMRAADDDAAWMDSDDLASLLDSDEEGSVGSYAGSE